MAVTKPSVTLRHPLGWQWPGLLDTEDKPVRISQLQLCRKTHLCHAYSRSQAAPLEVGGLSFSKSITIYRMLNGPVCRFWHLSFISRKSSVCLSVCLSDCLSVCLSVGGIWVEGNIKNQTPRILRDNYWRLKWHKGALPSSRTCDRGQSVTCILVSPWQGPRMQSGSERKQPSSPDKALALCFLLLEALRWPWTSNNRSYLATYVYQERMDPTGLEKAINIPPIYRLHNALVGPPSSPTIS